MLVCGLGAGGMYCSPVSLFLSWLGEEWVDFSYERLYPQVWTFRDPDERSVDRGPTLPDPHSLSCGIRAKPCVRVWAP